MAGPERIDAIFPAQGFDQAQARIDTQKSRFQGTFRPFPSRLGIGDDATAHAHPPTLPGGQFKGTDRHIEPAIPRRRQPADSAGIHPARLPLQFMNDLHGANFRRAGDRTTGK